MKGTIVLAQVKNVVSLEEVSFLPITPGLSRALTYVTLGLMSSKHLLHIV